MIDSVVICFMSLASNDFFPSSFVIVYSDILYLNKQRLLAVEELNKANQEKELLLDKIEQY